MPIIRVSPGDPRSTHDISFSDGEQTFGVRLDGGPKGIQELPVSPSTLLVNQQGGKYGDWDPANSHLQQDDWTGGRGQEKFVDDPSKFFDSQAAWTLTPGRVLNGPQWRLAAGMSQKNFSLPGNMSWYKMIAGSGNARYRARSFTDSGSTSAEQIYIWIRRRGAPGTLTLELCANSGNAPSTVLATATVTTASVTDTISVFRAMDWAGTVNLTGGTLYWVKVYGASTDNSVNHWEVGADPTGVTSGAGKTSADGSTWSDNTIGMYFWLSNISSANVAINAYYRQDWKLFFMEGATYAVSRYRAPYTVTASDTDSLLFINGDRGTVSSSASQLTVTDSTKSWTTNQWAGAKVRLIAGPGDGEWRAIASNTSTALTVSPAFNATQTTATRYIIYDTPTWTAITSGVPSDFVVTDVEVVNGIAFFARGGAAAICQFRSNPTTSAHEFDTTETLKCQLLRALNHPDDGIQLWKSGTGSVAVARSGVGDDGFAIDNASDKTKLNTATVPLKAWVVNQWATATVTILAGPGVGESRTITSNTATQLTVSVAFTVTHTAATQYQIAGWKALMGPNVRTQVGDNSYNITNMVAYNNELYVFKEDSLWRVVNDRAMPVPVGLDASPGPNNGVSAVAQNLFLYFPWSHSVERLYGGTLDDFGPWKGRGLPAGRAGPVSAMEPAMSWLFAAIDGGPDGTSCVMAWNGMGWHEIFRAWGTGWRIRQLKWVPQVGGRAKLYISIGPLLIFMHMPLDTLNPQNDSGFIYQHESVLVTSTYDMGATRLPKFFKEFEGLTDSLRRTSSSVMGRSIELDYQLDDNIGGAAWTYAGSLDNSPIDAVQIMRGNKRAIRFRLRLNIESATSPLPLRATTVEGYARTPVKYQYNLRIKVSSLMRTYAGQPDRDPDVFLDWLKQMAGSASRVTVQSVFPQWNNRLVIIEPPSVTRTFANRVLAMWGGVLVITVRNA